MVEIWWFQGITDEFSTSDCERVFSSVRMVNPTRKAPWISRWNLTWNHASTWVCLKIGYIPNYSHLIGIMISKTIGKMGYTIFRQTHLVQPPFFITGDSWPGACTAPSSAGPTTNGAAPRRYARRCAKVGRTRGCQVGWRGWIHTIWLFNIAIENGHRNSGFSHEKWWFSIVT